MLQNTLGYYATPEYRKQSVDNHERNSFCGPAVLSAVLGIDTDTAAKEIQAQRHGAKANKPVTGATLWELRKVMDKYGWESHIQMERQTSAHKIVAGNFRCRPYATWARWVREHGKYDTLYIIMLSKHFILYYNGLYCDNGSVHWRDASQYDGQRERVISTLVVYKLQGELPL